MRPYLRAANVTWSGIDVDDVKEMPFTETESETYELCKGDLLLSEASGSPTEVGKPGQFRGEVDECCFQNTLIRVRLKAPLNADYYEWYLRHQALSGRFVERSRGLGIQHLGAKTLAAWAVPIPPLDEQACIVTKLQDVIDLIRRLKRELPN
jgi:type I restriction enzyme S subunit